MTNRVIVVSWVLPDGRRDCCIFAPRFGWAAKYDMVTVRHLDHGILEVCGSTHKNKILAKIEVFREWWSYSVHDSIDDADTWIKATAAR